ncbi:Glutamate-rich protein 3 [Schistosoma japonicum]|nr:Glutamate-rich protein 3 [Schistosoma japonicum]
MLLKSKASFLEAYNSLADKHLVNYFSIYRIRRHLINNGMITEKGEIIPESEYRETQIRENLKRAFVEMIVHAIIERSLEAERLRQGKLKRDLEELCRLNRIRRFKEERQRRLDEVLLSKLVMNSPRSAEKFELLKTHYLEDINTEYQQNQLNASRRKPVKKYFRQKKHFGHQTDATMVLFSEPHRRKSLCKKSSSCSMKNRQAGQLMPSSKHIKHKSSEGDIQRNHQTEIIDDFDRTKGNKQELGNPCKINGKDVKETRKTFSKCRRLPPSEVNYTACIVKFMYLGISRAEESSIQRAIDQQRSGKGQMNSMNDNDNNYNQSLARLITVIQQPNGGNTLTVFKGLLRPGDIFQIISKRAYGFPFSLTIYVDGTQDTRISACCEYRHRQGVRVDGKHGHFVYLSVEGSFPCCRCQEVTKLKKEQSKVKKKQKFLYDEKGRKIRRNSLKVYEDDFELDDKKIDEDEAVNTDNAEEGEGEEGKKLNALDINNVDIITVENDEISTRTKDSDSTSSFSTISRLNREVDYQLSSIAPQDVKFSKAENGKDDSEINFMEYFKAALRSLVLNDTNINGCLRCIIWLNITLKQNVIMKNDNDDEMGLPSKNPAFCEAIIRQQGKELIRLALPKPNTYNKLKLRWPLNDLKITDQIKYVDFCNLSNILSVPLSDVEKLELCLEIPEEDIMYKFVEHSTLTDNPLITFKNPFKVILEDENYDEMNDYSILQFLYELGNQSNSDVVNVSSPETFNNAEGDYDSVKSTSLPASTSLTERKIESPKKKTRIFKSASPSSTASSPSSPALRSSSSRPKSSKFTRTNTSSVSSNNSIRSNSLTPINKLENEIEMPVKNTTTVDHGEIISDFESSENNLEETASCISIAINDQDSEFQPSIPGSHLESQSILIKCHKVTGDISQHSLHSSPSSVSLPTSSDSFPPVTSFEVSQIPCNFSYNNSQKSTNDPIVRENHEATNNSSIELLTKFTEKNH